MDCGGKRSATPLFEPEGSSFKLVVSSCVRKRRRKMELKAGPGRFATSYCSDGAVQNVATPAEVPWGETIILHFCPSWPTHF